MRIRRGWVVLGVVALLGTAATLAPRALRRLDFFRVRRVEVVGARYLAGTDLVRALAIPPRASLFDDVEPVRRAALKVRGVRTASVSRRWPGTLVLKVRELEPVALTQLDKELALVDERGRVLPFDPTRVPADLPVAEADPVVARVVGRIRDADPEFFGVIVSAARGEDREVILESPGHRFLLQGDASTGQIRALAAVAQDLARKGRNYRELDARYADRVFVRGVKS